MDVFTNRQDSLGFWLPSDDLDKGKSCPMFSCQEVAQNVNGVVTHVNLRFLA
jgi:hypothetical protein